MRISTLLAIAVTAVAAAAISPAYGQALLDQQLGPTPPAAQPTAIPAPTPAVQKPAPNPGGPDIVSPDAVKKVDNDELIKDLMQPGTDKIDPTKAAEKAKEMLERMDTSGTRLAEKDPGEVTQETQRRIITDLDVMIEIAKRQQQQQSSSSSQQQQQPGQQRQPGQPGQNQQQGGNTPAGSEQNSRGGITDAQGDMRNRDPSNWGGLPPRDREQISNGVSEEYLSPYSEMIKKYYQALAEMGRSRR